MAKTIFPAVYVEEITKMPLTITSVETALPVFIGYTQKAEKTKPKDLVFKPTRIASLIEYEKFFGLPFAETSIELMIDTTHRNNIRVQGHIRKPSNYLMAHALELFFANGGGPCYIVSVGTYNTKGIISLSLLSRGLKKAGDLDDATLLLFPDSTRLSSFTDYYSLHREALQQAATLKNRFVIMDVWTNNNPGFDAIHAFRNFDFGANTPLSYGAAYYPFLKTNLFYYEEDGSGVRIVCVNNSKLNGTLKALREKHHAAYEAARKAIASLEMILPASGAVAGVFALVDRTRGVWKAPANYSLAGVIAPAIPIDNSLQDKLYVDVQGGKSINVIRHFHGKGTLIWGARTLAGNDNEWRYISVRRFFIMVEQSVYKSIQQFVFEPNDANSWARVKGMIENYLILQWRNGALQGTKPDEAFFVRVGLGQTMTANYILEGRMIVLIGMAVVRPAEFIILNIVLKMSGVA